jgi:hypothetical protein
LLLQQGLDQPQWICDTIQTFPNAELFLDILVTDKLAIGFWLTSRQLLPNTNPLIAARTMIIDNDLELPRLRNIVDPLDRIIDSIPMQPGSSPKDPNLGTASVHQLPPSFGIGSVRLWSGRFEYSAWRSCSSLPVPEEY